MPHTTENNSQSTVILTKILIAFIYLEKNDAEIHMEAQENPK